jgi:hypothetical protein
MSYLASAGVLDVSRADGILANTAAPTVCITSDLPVTRSKWLEEPCFWRVRTVWRP